MEAARDTMPRVIAHDTCASALGEGLDDLADLCVWLARAADCDGGVKAVASGLDQINGIRVLLSLLSDRVRGIQVAVEALMVQGDVEVDNVAILERPLVGDTVADDLIDRGADALGVSMVSKWAWVAVALDGLLKDDLVNLVGGDARADMGRRDLQDLASKLAWCER